jgi:hypothetical protein
VGTNEGVAEWDLVRKSKRYVPAGVNYVCESRRNDAGSVGGSDAEVLATF